MSKWDVVAVWMAGGSLLVSIVSLFVTWRAGRHIKVHMEALDEGGQPWLAAIVRNPGGVSGQITGWGYLGSRHFMGRYKKVHSDTTGSLSLGAPDTVPYELQPAAYIRLSWESAKASAKYRDQYSSTPKWLRVYIEVGWKRTSIKSRTPRRWPQARSSPAPPITSYPA
jgi:hypothetical protein